MVKKGATTKLKGFKIEGEKVEGIVLLSTDGTLSFEASSGANKKETSTPSGKTTSMPTCPKCGKGSLIKGKTAYGCSDWKSGCDFRFAFDTIKERANGKPLTKELVLEIIAS